MGDHITNKEGVSWKAPHTGDRVDKGDDLTTIIPALQVGEVVDPLGETVEMSINTISHEREHTAEEMAKMRAGLRPREVTQLSSQAEYNTSRDNAVRMKATDVEKYANSQQESGQAHPAGTYKAFQSPPIENTHEDEGSQDWVVPLDPKRAGVDDTRVFNMARAPEDIKELIRKHKDQVSREKPVSSTPKKTWWQKMLGR